MELKVTLLSIQYFLGIMNSFIVSKRQSLG